VVSENGWSIVSEIPTVQNNCTNIAKTSIILINIINCKSGKTIVNAVFSTSQQNNDVPRLRVLNKPRKSRGFFMK